MENADSGAVPGFASQVLHGKGVVEQGKRHAQLVVLVYHGEIAGAACLLHLSVDTAESLCPVQDARFPGPGVLDVHEQLAVPAQGAMVDAAVAPDQCCYTPLCRYGMDLREALSSPVCVEHLVSEVFSLRRCAQAAGCEGREERQEKHQLLERSSDWGTANSR